MRHKFFRMKDFERFQFLQKLQRLVHELTEICSDAGGEKPFVYSVPKAKSKARNQLLLN